MGQIKAVQRRQSASNVTVETVEHGRERNFAAFRTVKKPIRMTTVSIAVTMGTPTQLGLGPFRTAQTQTPVNGMVVGQWVCTGATMDKRRDCVLRGCSLWMCSQLQACSLCAALISIDISPQSTC